MDVRKDNQTVNVEKFAEIIGSDFYTGVPDSQLKALCNYLINTYGIDVKHHIIAANEGNSVALAAGYYMATGKVPVVYMQNSGEGNIINPVASLLNNNVYAIPVVFIIGWRGEPGIHDEPQHIFQGEVTIKLLENMGIESFVVSSSTTENEISSVMNEYRKKLDMGKDVAFVIRSGALTYDVLTRYENNYTLMRETVIQHIVEVSVNDPIISTTGKVSRELFEIRKARGQSHKYDFLTVGSMGHSSSIALGVAASKPESKVWCIDGDGAVLMHMGSMAVIGTNSPANMIHIIINNEAHETVGGMPTVAAAGKIDFVAIAKACGYPNAVNVSYLEALDEELIRAKSSNMLSLIEIKCMHGSRDNLGRPTKTPLKNRDEFMNYLRELK